MSRPAAGRLVTVPFSGDGAGVGPLTWSQQSLWQAIKGAGTTSMLMGVCRLPDGTTVDAAVEILRRHLCNYPALRTRFTVDPDGHPTQVVSAGGELAVPLLDVPAGGNAEQVAHAEALRSQADGIEPDAEWPVRAAIVVQEGIAPFLVLTVNHLVIDGGGFAVLMADGGVATPDGTARALWPLELADRESTPAGARRSRAALAYWDGLLRTVPLRRFSPPTADAEQAGTGGGEPRHWGISLVSEALYHSVRVIAARTRTATATVLLALFLTALSRATGVHPAATAVVANNRFRRDFAEIVGPVSQLGLCVVDTADASVHTVVGRTSNAALSAYKYAYYDPTALDELMARISRERGGDIRLDCLYNDRRMYHAQAADQPVADLDRLAAQAREALARTTYQWLGPLHSRNNRLLLQVEDVPDVVLLSVHEMDSHLLPRDALLALLQGMEALAVATALDPSAPTQVTRRLAHV